jgi:RHH-type rel operon transcriptional repressor/antitoxin RelB
MTQSTTITIRLEPELKSRLDQLAEATHRSKSFLAAEAIREFIELNEWQIQEIKAALKEADEGDFASDEEVNTVLSKWGVSGD